jgi:predicted metal-dependent hydrolase
LAKKPHIALVAGRPLRLQVRRSARARYLRLLVSARRGAEVVMPRWATRRDVDEMLKEAESWLVEQVERHRVWDGPRRRAWTTGSELSLLGVPRRVELAPLPPDRRRARVTLSDHELLLELPPHELLDPRVAVERWLRSFAGRELRRRTALWSERTGLFPARVMVGERTSRWGSCSARGTLSYCYRIVMAPSAVVDAVVVHELCHLRYMDHGPRFHALVRSILPDHDERMDWLGQHGHELEV